MRDCKTWPALCGDWRYNLGMLILYSAFLTNGCTHAPALAVDSDSGHEVLLLLEYGKIFLVSPQGGEAQMIPHSAEIHLVRGSSATPTLLVGTLDEHRRRVFEELSLEGKMIQRYDVVPPGHGITFPPDGERRDHRHEAYLPDRRFHAYWLRSKPPPDPQWDLILEDFSGSSPGSSQSKIITRGLSGYGFVGLLQWSPDGQWLIWGEVNDRGRLLGRERFYRFFRIRLDGSGLQEVEIERPFWHRLFRTIWPPDVHGYPFDLQWWKVPPDVSR